MARTLIHQTVSSLLALVLVGSNLLSPDTVRAEVPLRQAVIQSLRNTVRLLLQNQSPREAKVKDSLVPGDGVSTARRSRAELRFNDGSLARIGEQALFRFLPNTRNFQLNNGTVLLLIPRGRGQTRIRTPNAVTGIRGSALFVRYVPESDTTIVGALTTSGIEVATGESGQSQPLQAGQMAVVVKDQIPQVLNFDLRRFYETSSLVSGLNLSGQETSGQVDADLAIVQAETQTALNEQEPSNNTIAQNPDFLRPPAQPEGTAAVRPIDFTLAIPLLGNQPLRFPPTEIIVQPSDVERQNPGRGDGLPPGLTRTTPGQNDLPPGLVGTTPGRSGNTPGQNGSLPPGLAGTSPGRSGNTPGQNGSLPPGLAGTSPGRSGNTPGQNGSLPPGLAGTSPGRSGNTPGRSGN